MFRTRTICAETLSNISFALLELHLPQNFTPSKHDWEQSTLTSKEKKKSPYTTIQNVGICQTELTRKARETIAQAQQQKSPYLAASASLSESTALLDWTPSAIWWKGGARTKIMGQELLVSKKKWPAIKEAGNHSDFHQWQHLEWIRYDEIYQIINVANMSRLDLGNLLFNTSKCPRQLSFSCSLISSGMMMVYALKRRTILS